MPNAGLITDICQNSSHMLGVRSIVKLKVIPHGIVFNNLNKALQNIYLKSLRSDQQLARRFK